MKIESTLLFDGMKLWRLELAWSDDGELWEVSLVTLGSEVELTVDLCLDSAWVRFGTMGQIIDFDIDANVALDELAKMVNSMVAVAEWIEHD